MTASTLAYLGPEGTFTHQAARAAAEALAPALGGRPALEALPGVPAIMRAVEEDGARGVIAWENNVEGYVVPNLDALIDAADCAGFARVAVDVAFDAFVRPDPAAPAPDPAAYRGATVSAHPHGLAQCKAFIADHGLVPAPAPSNAAACRDLTPGEVALGPAICGDLYGLTRLASGVQDYRGARTEFLVLARRDDANRLLAAARGRGVADYESIVAFIPLSTGPGVLADLLDVLRDAGLNMTSFISRPIKGHDGTYSFIATIDAAPWSARFQRVFHEVTEHGDWVKTLAVYPRRERPNPPVDAWMLPRGGVHLDGSVPLDAATAGRELMWGDGAAPVDAPGTRG